VTNKVTNKKSVYNEKHHSLFPHTVVRCSISTKRGLMTEEIRAVIAPPTFSDPINSLAARGNCL